MSRLVRKTGARGLQSNKIQFHANLSAGRKESKKIYRRNKCTSINIPTYTFITQKRISARVIKTRSKFARRDEKRRRKKKTERWTLDAGLCEGISMRIVGLRFFFVSVAVCVCLSTTTHYRNVFVSVFFRPLMFNSPSGLVFFFFVGCALGMDGMEISAQTDCVQPFECFFFLSPSHSLCWRGRGERR